MQRKAFTVLDFKAANDGSFTATFSLFNTPDLDNDVTLPGAFEDGAPVRVAAWGHNWGALPPGAATIRTNPKGAQAAGQFFIDTAHGKDTYLTVKGLSTLQQWSYGFEVLSSEPSTWQGQAVRFLKRIQVHEVSPVMLGAQPLTSTDAIKGQPLSPQQRELLRIKANVYRHQIPFLRREIAQLEEIEAARERFIARGWMKR